MDLTSEKTETIIELILTASDKFKDVTAKFKIKIFNHPPTFNAVAANLNALKVHLGKPLNYFLSNIAFKD